MSSQTLLSSVWPSATAPKLFTLNLPQLFALSCKRLLLPWSLVLSTQKAVVFNSPLPLPVTSSKQNMDSNKSNLTLNSKLMLHFIRVASIFKLCKFAVQRVSLRWCFLLFIACFFLGINLERDGLFWTSITVINSLPTTREVINRLIQKVQNNFIIHRWFTQRCRKANHYLSKYLKYCAMLNSALVASHDWSVLPTLLSTWSSQQVPRDFLCSKNENV